MIEISNKEFRLLVSSLFTEKFVCELVKEDTSSISKLYKKLTPHLNCNDFILQEKPNCQGELPNG